MFRSRRIRLERDLKIYDREILRIQSCHLGILSFLVFRTIYTVYINTYVKEMVLLIVMMLIISMPRKARVKRADGVQSCRLVPPVVSFPKEVSCCWLNFKSLTPQRADKSRCLYFQELSHHHHPDAIICRVPWSAHCNDSPQACFLNLWKIKRFKESKNFDNSDLCPTQINSLCEEHTSDLLTHDIVFPNS